MRSTELVLAVAVAIAVQAGCRSKPPLPPSEVIVTVVVPGSSAEEIETSVTNILEEVLAHVPRLAHLRSTTTPGKAEVRLQLEPGSDADVARESAIDAIVSVRKALPATAYPPTVSRSAGPIVARYLITSGQLSHAELSVFVDTEVKRLLETSAGVGLVELRGERMPVTEIVVDSARMMALGLDVNAIVTPLSRAPGDTVEQLAHVVVRETPGSTVYVNDVATVLMSMRPATCTVSYRGHPAIEVIVHAHASANVDEATTAIAEAIHKASMLGAASIVTPSPSTPLEVRVAPGTRAAAAHLPNSAFEFLEAPETGPWRVFVDSKDDPARTVDVLARRPGVAAVGTSDATIEIVGPDLAAVDAAARALPVKPLAIIGGDGAPEQTVSIDRNRAADLGVPAGAIATTVAVALHGQPVRRAIVRVAAKDPEALLAIPVRSTTGTMIPLSQFVTLTQTPTREIAHVDRQRMVGLRVRAADVTSLPELTAGISIRLVQD